MNVESKKQRARRSFGRYTRVSQVPDEIREQLWEAYTANKANRAAAIADVNRRNPGLGMSHGIADALLKRPEPTPPAATFTALVDAVKDARDLVRLRAEFRDTYGCDPEELMRAVSGE